MDGIRTSTLIRTNRHFRAESIRTLAPPYGGQCVSTGEGSDPHSTATAKARGEAHTESPAHGAAHAAQARRRHHPEVPPSTARLGSYFLKGSAVYCAQNFGTASRRTTKQTARFAWRLRRQKSTAQKSPRVVLRNHSVFGCSQYLRHEYTLRPAPFTSRGGDRKAPLGPGNSPGQEPVTVRSRPSLRTRRPPAPGTALRWEAGALPRRHRATMPSDAFSETA